jgi:hypothetical protein
LVAVLIVFCAVRVVGNPDRLLDAEIARGAPDRRGVNDTTDRVFYGVEQWLKFCTTADRARQPVLRVTHASLSGQSP